MTSCSLMAPAATTALFESHFAPLLNKSGFGIDDFGVYNLSETLEPDDNVGGVYGKSLLYLVSQAFEETLPAPILGMMRFAAHTTGLPSHRSS